MLLLQILDLKTRLLREKGKEIENKHIRNKNTYNNKTTTITTENINKNSFQKTYLIYRMITTTAVVKTTTIPKQRPMATGVLCLFSSLAWADSYRVGKKIIVFSLILTVYVKHDLKYSQSFLIVKTISKEIYIITNYEFEEDLFFLECPCIGKMSCNSVRLTSKPCFIIRYYMYCVWKLIEIIYRKNNFV